ncbi:MAG TPA: hypothetical protein VFT22_39015 [Kofleriaceae bacterium]|nr:hypothetical protein [Kofleriaceae bacterium]
MAELVLRSLVGGVLQVVIHSVEGARDRIGKLARGAHAYAAAHSSDSGQAERPSVVTGVTVVS